jgi:AcrR family transcriptional regulator
LAGKRVFFESGYQLTSVDRIAEAAGTTKRTVYDHFGSKEALFAQVVEFASNQFIELLPAAADLPAEPREGLRAFALRLRELVNSPDAIRFQRLIIAEAERQPDLGRALYATAVLGAERIVAAYLHRCVTEGHLVARDASASARLLVEVAAGPLRLRTLLCSQNETSDALDMAMIEQIVTIIADPGR